MIDASWETEKTDPREKFRESLVERAELRLSRARPIRRGPDEWELPGYEDLGDEYPRYTVRLAGNRYVCTCYGHYGGEVRQRRICSHVLAVILWRKQHREDFSTPAELGLPAKFGSFRPVQVEALKKIMATDKRWILLQAPTGTGKTLCAAAAQKLLKKRMLYTCHTKDLQAQFCVGPDTRILTADLRWVRAGEIRPGDCLLAFDEHLSPSRRMWRLSVVEAVATINRPCYLLTFHDGTEVLCSAEHMWLAGANDQIHKWLRTDHLRSEDTSGKFASKVVRLLDPWSEDSDRDAGYLAAAFDGEGSLSQRKPARGTGVSVHLMFSQGNNEMLAEVMACLERKCFPYKVHQAKDGCNRLYISGRHEVIRFLGQIRPRRLLARFDPNSLGMINPTRPAILTKKKFVGVAQVIAIRTSTGTYVAEGLASHNCRDFPYAVELKGRENYPTAQYAARWPEIHCGLCTKTKADPRCKWCCPPNCYRDAPCLAYGEGRCETGWRTCPYEEQKKAALVAEVAVLNFAMFLGEANYAGGFGGAKFPLVVCDEADMLEGALMSFAELSISSQTIERLDLEPPKYKTKEEAWIEWVKGTALPRVSARIAELERPDAWGTVSIRDLKEKRELERVKNKLEFFANQIGSSKWVNCTENHEEGPWVWKPVYVSGLAERYLWRHGERFLLMSATILEPRTFARNLGIPDGEWEFIDLPSTFPKENRPVYYIPCANMTHKTAQDEWPKVVEAVDAVLDAHPDDKVLVHTVSYSLSRYIAGNTRHKGRVIIYDGARDRAAALERFRASDEPLVMLAPSMERGVDLPDDLCRVVVIVKVPYRSLGDKQVSARLYGSKDGRAWYVVDAIRTLVQMSGRGVRHERDWAKTYILDAQFGLVLKEWKRAFPQWWLEALETRPTI